MSEALLTETSDFSALKEIFDVLIYRRYQTYAALNSLRV